MIADENDAFAIIQAAQSERKNDDFGNFADQGKQSTPTLGVRHASSRGRRNALAYICLLLAVAYLVMTAVEFKHYALPVTDANPMVETDGFLNALGLVLLANAGVFMTYLFQRLKDIEERKGPQRIQPTGAFYWWFVPFAFFWKPYEAVKIAVQDADEEVERDDSALGELKFWWAFWLASWLGGVFLPPFWGLSPLEPMYVDKHRTLLILLTGIEAGSAWFYLRVVHAMMGGLYFTWPGSKRNAG